MECSPIDFEWHLLLQNKIIAYSAGEVYLDPQPPKRGKSAVPESARRWGPALIHGAAVNPRVVGWERTKESGPLSGTLLALYVCYSPLNSSNSPERRWWCPILQLGNLRLRESPWTKVTQLANGKARI